MAGLNKKEVIIWVLLALAGLAVSLGLYEQASPSASVDLEITREEATIIAEEYLQGLGVNVDDYRQATTFTFNSPALIYMQQTLGMEATNQRILEQDLPIWLWSVRWFRSQQIEEYRVAVAPDGDVIAYSQVLGEDTPGGDIGETEARSMAEDYLRDQGFNLNDYELVDDSSEKFDQRTDHHFEWKQRNFDLGESEYRIGAGVFGDHIGRLRNYIKVPENFEREFQDTQAAGQMLSIFSLLFMVVIFGLALFVFVQKYKKDDLRWRFSITFALTVVVLGIFAGINSIPLLQSAYPTQINYTVFLATTAIVAVVLLLIYGVFILLTGASGESLTREQRPESVKPLHDLIAGRLLTPDFAAAVLRGYLAAVILLGYLTLFYVIGQNVFGVWTAPDSPYSNTLNTVFPFLYPLFVGVVAAISEEFTFRLFAIPFLQRYIRNTFIVLLIPAMIWAFGHSDYPVFPVYVRGIELTIAGLFFGYLYIRYDILTCIIAHYALDAFLVGLPLINSSNTFFQVSGLIVTFLGIILIIPAVIVWFRKNKTGNYA